MSQQDSLAELLAACARDDQRAFEQLYRRTSAKLYAVCLALLRKEDMAEDVLQDSFVKIWHRAGSYDPGKGSAMTWMTSIVRNRALDLLRSASVQAERVSDEYSDADFATLGQGPSAAAEQVADARAVLNCLDQLDERHRRCILMAYYYGHTHDELSQRLKTPLGTVKAWIRRGLERLRECLG